MSSTDVMSVGSLHDYSSENNLRKTPTRKKRRTPPSSPQLATDEVQCEIDDLLIDVPVLGEHFDILNKIGSGTFSSVFVAKLKNLPQLKEKFALKHILPTSHPDRIENELRCLQEIGGCANVMGVKACLRQKDHVVIIMPYFPHDRFQDYVGEFSLPQVREYIKNLLIALRRVHSVDIIHRDIKPSNFLYNRQLNTYALVDFGLAQKAPVPLQKQQASTSGTSSSSSTSQHPHGNKKPSPSRALSPRKAKLTASENMSPKKRKMEESENVTESPRKKHAGSEQKQAPRKLAERNPNTAHTEIIPRGKCHMEAMKGAENRASMDVRVVLEQTPKELTTPSPVSSNPFGPQTSKSQSPRRVAMLKNAQRTQQPSFVKDLRSMPKTGRTTVVLGSGSKAMYKSVAPSACQCFGQPMICSICMSRMNQVAPRAGTPGFRSPEVLMKCPAQTTAVDMWSAGVIFLSLLTGRYPFFKANDDMTALAQIISIVGSDEMKTAARTYNKELTCSPTVPAVNLRILCSKLHEPVTKRDKARRSHASQDKSWENVPDSAYDLLKRLLDLNPATRISAHDALQHPFITEPLS